MRIAKLFALASAAALLGLSAMPASAISSEGSCELSDVTTDTYGNANACYGLVEGNIETSGTFNYGDQLNGWSSFAGGGWSVLGDVTFDTSTHTWTSGTSGFSELIIVLKQATLWGAWYFNPADSSGTWSTSWIFKNGNTGPGGGLSHGFALVRGTTTTVPEPGTLALLGIGMLGVMVARRRKQH